MFGDKLFQNKGFPTPTSVPETTSCLIIQVPDSDEWYALVVGVLYILTMDWNWQQFEGGISVEDAAAAWQVMFDATMDYMAVNNTCGLEYPAPFWDDESADDADDQMPAEMQPWYGSLVIVDDNLTFVENAFIWVVAGFIAYAGLPGAALSFVPLAQRFVVTVKSNPLGGVIRFLADAVEIGRVDTYSPTDVATDVMLALPESVAFSAESAPEFWVELLPDNPHDLESVTATIVRSRLSEQDFAPTDIRYSEITDELQITTDGGTTWVDNPGIDQRHVDAYRYPARTTTDPNCDAAANALKWIKDYIEGVIALLDAGASVYAVVNTILRFMDLIFAFTPGEYFTLFLTIAGELTTLGAAALTAAFTSDQYDLLMCIFFCHMDASGQVSAEEFTPIMDDVTALLNTTAALVVNLILFSQGEVGLSNAGAIGDEVGDCSACECEHCFRIDFEVEDGSAYGVSPVQSASPDNVTWVSGTGWVGGFVNSVNVNDVSVDWLFPSVLNAADAEVEFIKPMVPVETMPTCLGASTLGSITTQPRLQ